MNGAAARRAGPLLGLLIALGACGHQRGFGGGNDDEVNAYPTNYKSDILAGMHAYLNDPTGIRDAAIAQPALKSVGDNVTHYIVCMRFNAKKNAAEYAGAKEVAAVFLLGRLDRFMETPKEQCSGATYAPFPELEKLPP